MKTRVEEAHSKIVAIVHAHDMKSKINMLLSGDMRCVTERRFSSIALSPAGVGPPDTEWPRPRQCPVCSCIPVGKPVAVHRDQSTNRNIGHPETITRP